MKLDQDFIITITDCRRGHCARGIKKWFEGMGFDFRDFLRNGISAQKLLDTGDAQAVGVVKRAVERKTRNG